MSPSITISTDYTQEKEDFLNTFQLFGTKTKQIFKCLWRFSNKYKTVFPSHELIAQEVGCSIRTVVRALKLFADRGWIGSKRRCYRSNVYFMSEFLKSLDPTKAQTFMVQKEAPDKSNVRENVTENVTLYNVLKRNIRCTYNEPNRQTVQSSSDFKKQQDPQVVEKQQILTKIGISKPKDIWCLCRYSLRALSLAAEDMISRTAKNAIGNPAAWITQRCKEYTKKYGLS